MVLPLSCLCRILTFYLSFCHHFDFPIDNQLVTGCRCMVADSSSATPCFALFPPKQKSSDLLPVAELLVQAPRTVSSKSVNRFWTCLEHLLMVDEVGRWQLMTDGWQMKRISATRNWLNTNPISVKGGRMANKTWKTKIVQARNGIDFVLGQNWKQSSHLVCRILDKTKMIEDAVLYII